ncbi:hypothetical protein GWC95_17870 [Sediminibacterium roseum]|uniref:Uncharacterized protein n=2 Tax=Sediminibacterium roseum TaxID=1978412 RepID=A0ABW9ZXB4_9BACT|nr:hypothetical protein [Sediminibacterium roseum]
MTAKNQDPFKECGNCSPFSTCSTCHGFACKQETMVVSPAVFDVTPEYVDHSSSFGPGYRNSFFKPPRNVYA